MANGDEYEDLSEKLTGNFMTGYPEPIGQDVPDVEDDDTDMRLVCLDRAITVCLHPDVISPENVSLDRWITSVAAEFWQFVNGEVENVTGDANWHSEYEDDPEENLETFELKDDGGLDLAEDHLTENKE